jgi:four helix bundle protein
MKSWKELNVWQKTHALVLRVYEVTAQFPAAERYRLTDQLCRAASSVSANIVEGQSRQTTREYLQFLYNARGSLEETRYHLLLARDFEQDAKWADTCTEAQGRWKDQGIRIEEQAA